MRKLNSQELINKAKNFTYNIITDRLSAYRKIVENAIIIVGGSVSLGLADEESDIDYGIILPNHSDFVALGRQIGESIGGRFHNYEGFLIDIHLCSLRSFGMREKVSSDDEWWEGLSPTDIFSIQHAVIIQDPNEIFRFLKVKVKEFPPDILKRRIVGRWGFLSMWVDFARQCSKRNDKIGSFTFTARAIQEIMMLGFLLNGHSYPDPKYRYRLFHDLPKSSKGITPILERVVSSSDMEERYSILTNIVSIYSKHMRENKVIDAKYIEDWLQCFDIGAESLF